MGEVVKQIRYYDRDNDTVHGAILFPNGTAICGCCGSWIDFNEVGDDLEILEVYKTWIPLCDTIIGE